MTKSGWAATISAVLAVQESATMAVPRWVISRQTSAQYFVHATRRLSWPMAARITVALGCKETTRCGVRSEATIDQSYKGMKAVCAAKKRCKQRFYDLFLLGAGTPGTGSRQASRISKKPVVSC